MDARTHRGPVEPPFGCKERPWGEETGYTYITEGRIHTPPVEPPGCSGLHLIKSDVDQVVRRLGIPEAPDRRPRYFAEGEFVVVTISRRRMNLTVALAEAQRLLDQSIDPTIGDLADAYADELGDLISAMREAMGNRPHPPAMEARAA